MLRVVIFIVLSLSVIILAQNSNALPEGLVQCEQVSLCGSFPNPNPCTQCADGRIGDCALDLCVKNQDGGCSWYRKPPCLATPAPGTTSTPCQERPCPSNACSFGRKIIEGCPSCECNPTPSCDAVDCNVQCTKDQVFVPPTNGACCGSCKERPTTCPSCPLIECPASNDEILFGIEVDVCGCRHCIRQNCTEALCPAIKCAPEFVPFRPPGACCPTCVRKPRCPSNLRCADINCPVGWKRAVRDGDCCPTCVRVPKCNDVACIAVACEEGQKQVHIDGECCPRCVGDNDCEAVICPEAESSEAENDPELAVCNDIFTNTREGACCKVCSTCRRTEQGLIRCNDDDTPVCAPGLATGDGVTCTPVSDPSVTRVCKEFKVDRGDAALDVFDEIKSRSGDDDIRIAKYGVLRFVLAHVDAALAEKIERALQYLSVEIVRQGNSEIVLNVCWTVPSTDTDTNAEELLTATENSLVTAGLEASGSAVVPTLVVMLMMLFVVALF